MTFLKTALKNSKKKSGTQKSTKFDKKNQYNQELKTQIRDEIEKTQDQSMPKRDKSIIKVGEVTNREDEVENRLEEDKGTIKRNLVFRFAILWPVTTPKSKCLGKAPVTPTKISEELNFLKKLINNLSFNPKPVI